MNSAFNNYIRRRIDNPRLVSDVELDLLRTADSAGLNGEAVILYIHDGYFVAYHAAVNGEAHPSRIVIHGIGEEHPFPEGVLSADSRELESRNSLFGENPADGRLILDPYFLRFCGLERVIPDVRESLSALEFTGITTLLLDRRTYADKAVRYALESVAGLIVPLAEGDEPIEMRGRIEISAELLRRSVGLTFPMNTVRGVMLNKDAVYVPLDGVTLDSPFYGDVTWRTILGDLSTPSEADVEIAGARCRMLRLVPNVDSYGNLFVFVSSALEKGRQHLVLVDGPGMAYLSEALPESAPTTLPAPEPRLTPAPAPARKPQAKPEPVSKPQPKSAPVSRPEPHDAPKPRPSRPKDAPERPRPNVHADDAFVFEGESVSCAAIEKALPGMKRADVRRHLTALNRIFGRMTAPGRIVTDTNLWISEHPAQPKRMAYRRLIEHLLTLVKEEGAPLFEISTDVYDEIAKLAKSDVAASKEANKLLVDYLSLKSVDMPDLRLVRDVRAYADETIGYRVSELYKARVPFSILTNDTDAMVRWVATLRNLEKSLPEAERGHFPPYILCRDLQRVFMLRGKLLKQLKSLHE